MARLNAKNIELVAETIVEAKLGYIGFSAAKRLAIPAADILYKKSSVAHHDFRVAVAKRVVQIKESEGIIYPNSEKNC